MNELKAKIEKLNNQRTRHIFLRILFGLFVLMFVYRFVMFGMEQNKTVFNLTRDANANGVPVNVVEMHETDGVIYEPLFINDNRGLVSGMRIARFRVGQKITGGGEIVSVSNSLDLDSGMHIVRTRGVTNGAHSVEIRASGFYVPTYAVQNGNVFVVRDGVAHVVSVNVIRRDADNTMITGVADGDVVITSHITDGALIKVIK